MTRIGRTVATIAMLGAVLLSAAAAAADAFDRALSLASEGRHADARRLLAPLLESKPGDPQMQLLHGILQLQEGRRDEAISVFSGLAREYPDMLEAHNNLAVAYVEEGRLEEARAVLSAILERKPSVVGYRNLGDIYILLARRALALSRELGGSTGEEQGDGRTLAGELVPAHEEAGSASGAAVSERTASSGEPDAVSDRPAHTVATLTGFCIETAEFTDKGRAEDARQWLVSMGAEHAHVAHGSRETIRDHRLYLPPSESRGSAKAKLRELQEKGLRDVAVVLRGDLKNAVSLGVYASEANAKRRAAQLEALGYAPVLEPNTRAAAEYATIEARFGGSYDTLSDAWASHFPDRTVRQVDCD